MKAVQTLAKFNTRQLIFEVREHIVNIPPIKLRPFIVWDLVLIKWDENRFKQFQCLQRVMSTKGSPTFCLFFGIILSKCLFLVFPFCKASVYFLFFSSSKLSYFLVLTLSWSLSLCFCSCLALALSLSFSFSVSLYLALSLSLPLSLSLRYNHTLACSHTHTHTHKETRTQTHRYTHAHTL